MKTMLNLTATKLQLKVVFDQVGTLTYALELANAISTIIEEYKKSCNLNFETCNYEKSGIYHFSNEGICSLYGFTKMIADNVGNIRCDIQPYHSEESPSIVIRHSFYCFG